MRRLSTLLLFIVSAGVTATSCASVLGVDHSFVVAADAGGFCDATSCAPGGGDSGRDSSPSGGDGATGDGATGDGATGGCGTGGCVTTLASGQGGPTRLAVDSESVLWTNQTSATVMRLAKSGGSAVVLWDGGFEPPFDVVSDGVKVYWTTAAAGDVDFCDIASCGPSLVDLSTSSNSNRVAVTAGNDVYWTDTKALQIYTCPVVGGCNAPQPFVATPMSPFGIASAGGTIVYSTSGQDGGIYACGTPQCGTPQVVAPAQNNATEVAFDGSNVAWILAGGSGAIVVAPLSGGLAVTLASNQPGPSAIALGGGAVYWTNSGDGTVVRCPITGCGKPYALATGQSAPAGIALDATYAYWVNTGSGDVVRAPR